MKVEILKDVLISNTEVGTVGQVHNLPKEHAAKLMKRGLVKSVEPEEGPEAKEAKEPVATKEMKTSIKTK